MSLTRPSPRMLTDTPWTLKTIADLEALDTAGLPDGQQATVREYHAGTNRGGGTFVYDKASSATADGGKVFAASGGGRWVRQCPDGIYHIDWYGAITRNETEDTAAMQRIAAVLPNATNQWTVLLSGGDEYRFGDEIDLTQAQVGVGRNVIAGDGGKARIRVAALGGAKWLFRFPAEDSTLCEFRNLYFAASPLNVTEIQRKDRPGLIWMPRVSQGTKLINVDTSGSGHILAGNRIFNLDIHNCNFFHAGWQPIRKEVSDTARITTTAGSTTITANESVFVSGDVGEIIYINRAGGTGTAGSGWVTRIASVVSGTEATVDDAPDASVSGETFSFESIRADVTSGGTTVSFSSPHQLEASDVGRLIYIDKAGPDEEIFISTVTSITNTTTVEIEHAVETTQSGVRVFFTAAFSGGDLAEKGARTFINDWCFTNSLIEQYRGLGLFTGRGLNIQIDNFKFHGTSRSNNNFGVSGPSFAFSNTERIQLSQILITLSCGADEGQVGILRNSQLTASNINIGAVWANCPLWDVSVSADSQYLDFGPGYVNADMKQIPLSKARGIGYSPVRARSSIRQLGVMNGSVRQNDNYSQSSATLPSVNAPESDLVISNGAIETVPTAGYNGILVINSWGVGTGGVFHFRMGSTPRITATAAGSDLATSNNDLTETPGADGVITLSVETGALQVQNRTGSGISIQFVWLATRNY